MDQISDAVTVLANTKAHPPEGVLIPFLALSFARSHYPDTSDNSQLVWVLVVRAMWRAFKLLGVSRHSLLLIWFSLKHKSRSQRRVKTMFDGMKAEGP